MITPKDSHRAVVDVTGKVGQSYITGKNERWSNGLVTSSYTFTYTNVPPMGADDRHPAGHAVVCWLESDLMYLIIGANGYIVGNIKSAINSNQEVWKEAVVTGTNGNFGGPGQLATPPTLRDTINSLFSANMVWTCVVTLVSADQLNVTYTNDDPLYAGISWVTANTEVRTNWFAPPLNAGHGEVSREWREAMRLTGWQNIGPWYDYIDTPTGVRILSFTAS